MGLRACGQALSGPRTLLVLLAALVPPLLPTQAASQAYVDLAGEVATFRDGHLLTMSGTIATVVYTPNGTPLVAIPADGSPPKAITCLTNNAFMNSCRFGDGEPVDVPTPDTVKAIFAINNPEIAARQTRDAAFRATASQAIRSMTTQTQRSACQTIAGFIGGRIDDVLASQPGSPPRAVRADDASTGDQGAWIDGSVVLLAEDVSGRQFNGTLGTTLFGIDSRVSPNLVVGIAGGYESAALTTGFQRGAVASNGWTAAPYLGWNILDDLTLGLLGAFTFLDARMCLAYGPSQGGTPFRAMAGASLNYSRRIDDWRLNATAGYMHSHQTGNIGLSTADTFVGELRGGLKVGYVFAKTFEPYLAGAYIRDVRLSGDASPDMVEARIGFDVHLAQALRCGFEASSLFSPGSARDTRVRLSLRYEF